MSCSQRSVSRLPLHVFKDLISHEDDRTHTPSELRSAVSRKLMDAGRMMSKYNNQSSASAGGITTVGQVLRLTSPALLRILDPLFTNYECDELVLRICQLCRPEPVTAKVLLDKGKNEYIPCDVQALDSILRGGFRIGSVTEIVGRAGVGKTQLAMQLCVVAARMGYGSIFIDTERKLSLQRLHEIARERYKLNSSHEVLDSSTNSIGIPNFEYNLLSNGTENDIQNAHTRGRKKYSHPNSVMNNVTVHAPVSTEELLSVIQELDEEIILRGESSSDVIMDNSASTQFPVKVIILDSIAAPTRRDFGGGSAPQRVAAIFKIAQMLKRIAGQLKVAVVVINQIDKVQGASDFNSVKAALGTSWHHCVSTRVTMEHENDPHRDDALMNAMSNSESCVRTATVAKSNLVGLSSMLFEVNLMGICQVCVD